MQEINYFSLWYFSRSRSGTKVFLKNLGFCCAILQLFVFSPLLNAAQGLSENELSQALRFYHSLSDLQVSFEQTKSLKDLQIQLHAKGNMHFHAPDHLVWKITEPAPVTVTIEKSQMRIESGKGSQATLQTLDLQHLSATDSSQNLAALRSWLSLDAQQIAKDNVIEKLSAGHFKFTPIESGGKKSLFTDLEMSLGKNGHLEHFIMHERSGDSLDLQFADPKIIKQAQTTTRSEIKK